MVYPSSAVDGNRQECNRQSMQCVQTTWSNWDWIVSKCSDTNAIFQAAVFLIRVITNNKNKSKINDCLYRICLYFVLSFS